MHVAGATHFAEEPMRAHYLQHVPFEGLGSIETWLTATGYQISATRLFDSEQLPALDGIDLLVIMGGPMSVNDEQAYPWLTAEKRFVRDAIRAGKTVLGICLGAQLIASALGARVYPNAVKEIGWFPVTPVVSRAGSFSLFPESVDVFHWYGETFDLPPGATQLARSKTCENQAFQVGGSVIGLQFHLETTPESAKALVTNCRSELVPSETVQSEAEILAAPPSGYQLINALMDGVLSYLRRTHCR
jgi:GMP synthase-like glutamine amidotransferase